MMGEGKSIFLTLVLEFQSSRKHGFLIREFVCSYVTQAGACILGSGFGVQEFSYLVVVLGSVFHICIHSILKTEGL